MILLLGGTGYVGQAFARLLEHEGVAHRVVSRRQVDYTHLTTLVKLLERSRPTFLINAAGYTGRPNVDACELHKTECLQGNAVLPGTIRLACEQTGTPWGHVSSGCIYTGRRADGQGFQESDAPNFCFRTNNCSFYSGCKSLGEEVLEDAPHTYLWRLRIPFDHRDSPRNYLSKLIRYDRLLKAENSISQLDEFVRCCWECWQRRVPFGTYNVTNTGSITTEQVVELIRRELKLDRSFSYFESEAEFMATAAKTPRSNCVLDNQKLRATGIEISDVADAVIQSLRRFQMASHQPA